VSLRRGLAISFLDQSLLSLASFLVGLFLIRNTAKEQYGMYAVACAAVLFVVGVQNALVTTQMTVLAPRDDRGNRERFCAALASGQYLILLPFLAAAFAAAAAARTAGLLDGNATLVILSVCAAVPGVMLREFFRGYFFRLARPTAVLAMDSLYLALLGAGLGFFAVVFPAGLHVTALLVTGAAALPAGFAALFGAGMKPVFRLREISDALIEVWAQGRWALAGVMVTWLQDQSYLYLLAALAGAAETAEASAARLFLAPAALLNAGFARVLLPRWAALRRCGGEELIRSMARKALGCMTGAIVAYAAIILLVRDSLERLLGIRGYADLEALVVLWSVLFVIQACRSVCSWMLQASCRFAPLARANAVSAVVVLLLGTILIGHFGARGSVLALLVGEAVLMLLLWRSCRHAV